MPWVLTIYSRTSMCSLCIPIYSYSYICLGSTCCIATLFCSSMLSFGSASFLIFLAHVSWNQMCGNFCCCESKTPFHLWDSPVPFIDFSGFTENKDKKQRKKKKIGRWKTGKAGNWLFLCQMKRILAPSSKFNFMHFFFLSLCGVFRLVSTLTSPFDPITTYPMNSNKLLSPVSQFLVRLVVLDLVE